MPAIHHAWLVDHQAWHAEFKESLRERDLGVIEGLTTDEMLEKYPQEYQSFRNDGPEYQFRGVKVFASFMIVVRALLKMWQCVILGKKIGLVTHGGFLGAIFRYVLNIPLDAERNFVLLNCSINRLEKLKMDGILSVGETLPIWMDLIPSTTLRRTFFPFPNCFGSRRSSSPIQSIDSPVGLFSYPHHPERRMKIMLFLFWKERGNMNNHRVE